ncbi:MAG TPA: glycosyltransferase family 39 protein [Conexibacter sp.]|jgi:4-amino-4-deoxy-L-arabinose transferase-like glycosyltransferase|nr:glycosyltransferase family 39 protein [Conexibacter sp.]
MEAAVLTAVARARPAALAGRIRSGAPLAAILAIAAALRLWSFGAVSGNPFYDAAVRSMSQSWHNLFVGAFDPTAMSAVDKAPLDLWLQVASVKLLGFSSVALRLPEVIAGIAAVALVYGLGRRLFGRPAGLAAAAALAVLPASVMTARSDTMDAMMMALIVLSAWCVARAAATPETQLRWLLAAGAALGLAFNVKLAEALLPLPALLVLAWLGLGGGVAARVRALLAGGAAFVAVALAWLVAMSLAAGPKPFPIGSTNGSAWNVVFVFDGIGRLGLSKATAARPGGGPLTLLDTSTGALGTLVGSALLAGVIVGALALAVALVSGRGPGLERTADPALRLRRAGVAFVAVWLLVGIAVFSRMVVVYARYLDAIAPAIALAIGAGAAALATRAPTRRVAALALALAVGATVALAVPVASPRPGVWLAAAGVTVVLALLALTVRARAHVPARAFLVLALAGLLTVPAATAVRIAAGHESDSGAPGSMPTRQLTRLSTYLKAHRAGARYQLATMAAASAGAVIARDGQPVLVLTTAYGRPLVSPHQLAALVRAGQVRYVLAGGAVCVRGESHERTGCAPVVLWARAHGQDVGRDAGIRDGLLLRLRA